MATAVSTSFPLSTHQLLRSLTPICPAPSPLSPSAPSTKISLTSTLFITTRRNGPLPAAPAANDMTSSPPISSPSTPLAMTAHQHEIGVRDVEDREGVHSGGVDGIEYDPSWLAKLQVLGRVGGSIVRGIDADDLAHIEGLHASLDVPETSLFPWLHGIGDGNYSLDAFFSSFSSYESQLPAPRYRGLTVVQSPGPGDYSPASSSSEWVDGHASRSFTSSSSEIASDAGTSWVSSSSVSSFPTSVSSTSSCDINEKTPESSPSPSPLSSPQLHPQISTAGLVGLSTLESEPVSSTASAAIDHTPRNVLGCSVPASEVFTLMPVPTLAASPLRRPPGARRQSSRRGRPSQGFEEDVDLAVPDGVFNGEQCKGQFVRRRVGETISLRNLGLQVAKYATISDIVIYHPDGLCSSALNVAERAAEALEDMWHERKMAMGTDGDPVRYNIFVVFDSFKAIEAKHPDIVAIDSQGVVRNAIDLFAKEKRETAELTSAMEVSPGFWMGNTNDCPLSYGSDGDGVKTVKVEANPIGFDVCIEAFDTAEIPDHRRLAHAQRHLDTVSAQLSSPTRQDSNPLVDGLDQLHLDPDSSSSSDGMNHHRRQSTGSAETELIYHMSCVSTSLVVPQGDWRGLNVLASEVIELARWVYKQTSQGKKILMHGFDGYTESSIFALSLIMLLNNLSLPEAYLHLHLKSGRSFFVFAHDLPLLRKIDDRLSHERASLISSQASSTLSVPPVLKWKGGWSLGSWTWKDEQASQADLAQTKERREAEIEKHAAWFNDPTFEGSLPSRIVPFLYLGNIHHASNPLMLHALGITHVVSVGECALIDPRTPPLGISPHQAAPNHALWHEHQAGRIKVLDMKSISDDGISPLRPAIAEAVAWMEQARAEGGKILVHCKVGVSRSATVVIAYMMKHQGYSLTDAYMRTRARRLNVLIQPNLKFLYELQGWEVELSREQVEAEQALKYGTSSNPDLPRAKGRKTMSFPILCREIAAINRRYLGPGP